VKTSRAAVLGDVTRHSDLMHHAHQETRAPARRLHRGVFGGSHGQSSRAIAAAMFGTVRWNAAPLPWARERRRWRSRPA